MSNSLENPNLEQHAYDNLVIGKPESVIRRVAPSKDGSKEKPSASSLSPALSGEHAPASAHTATPLPPKKDCRWHTFLMLLVKVCYITGKGAPTRLAVLCAKHGGGAFLLAYLLCYMLLGVPLLFMELVLGQYTSNTPTGIFKRMAPGFVGLAVSMTLILVARLAVMSTRVVYSASTMLAMIHDMSKEGRAVMWENCIIWRSAQFTTFCYDPRGAFKCSPASGMTDLDVYCSFHSRELMNNFRANVRKLPTHAWLEESVYKLPFAPEHFDVGSTNVALSHAVIWLLACLCLWRGMKGVFAVSIPSLIIPFVIYAGFFVRMFFIADIKYGIEFLFTIDWSEMSDMSLWADAVCLVIFALCLGTGGAMAISSRNRFRHNVLWDVWVCAGCELVVSLIITVTFYGYAGHAAVRLYPAEDPMTAVKYTISGGINFFMSVIPDTMTCYYERPYKEWLGAAFFAANIFFGLQSIMIGVQIVQSSLLARYPLLSASKWNTRIFHVAFFLAAYVVTYGMTTNGGIYIAYLYDRFIPFAALPVMLVEVLVVMHVYGFRRFMINIRSMIGGVGPLNVFWYGNWLVTCPLMLILAIVFSYMGEYHMSMGALVFSTALYVSGWTMVGLVVVWMPALLLAQWLFVKRRNYPRSLLFVPSDFWGPADGRDRMEAMQMERAWRVRE